MYGCDCVDSSPLCFFMYQVLKRYLPHKNWKMRINEVPQPFQFKTDRIVGVLERPSGPGWEATVTPPAVG